jgi:hypothetical protein
MPEDASPAAERARSATAEEIKALVHDVDEGTLLALLENPALDEPNVVRLLERLELSANVLTAVAAEGKWTSSESVRLRLARHPRTPRRIALSLLRQLFLFDLVRLSLMPSTPAEIRRAAEAAILTRVPHLPVGEKLTLARRGPSRIAGAILAEGHPQAIKLALENAFLTESQLLKVLAKHDVPERVVAGIAQHPKWSCQYNIRLGLLRNAQTPVPVVLAILPDVTVRDLKEVMTVESLGEHAKKYIQQELLRRAGGAVEKKE